MKKSASLFTAACFVLVFAIAGCGDDNGDTTDTGTDTPDVVDMTEDVTPDVPEDRQEDPAEDPAEDTPEDVPPDTPEEDTVEDVPEETEGELPEGACTNPEDMAIIESPDIDVDDVAATCGTGCIADPNPVECTSTCLQEDIGLSEECADCFGGIVFCTIDHCLTQCMLDPEGDPCRTCLADAGCIDDFQTCSGIVE